MIKKNGISFNKSDFSKLTLTIGDDEISPSSTAKNFCNFRFSLDKYINAKCRFYFST